ncbi:sideroflexin-2 isoform X2 [Falco naumanni]|uniref:sideroflexin-2 isoform X2 n=1 Tax=Falco naumanni TaxID=148594 RepID=UPI001ADEA700|nr:sideroflexin-2 isoform X2 [Falco naumanni]
MQGSMQGRAAMPCHAQGGTQCSTTGSMQCSATAVQGYVLLWETCSVVPRGMQCSGVRENMTVAGTHTKMATVPLGFNIDAPRWDQSTFVGRLKHFLNITDPRTVLVPEEELDRAKALVEGCRAGLVPPGSSQEQLLYAKKLYDSAFHPDSGEKMNLIGRMSFQVPGGMAITGCMLQFYRTVPAVVFWQWVNQSFNALVNYTNRNAASPITLRQIGVAYFTATGTALATAVGLNLYTKRAPPLLARWVPFAAVAAANCVNIPMMRQQEIINGVTVTDGDNNELGRSRRAAVKGIAQVVVSRITMAAPGMRRRGRVALRPRWHLVTCH